MWEITFGIFIKSLRYETSWVRKNTITLDGIIGLDWKLAHKNSIFSIKYTKYGINFEEQNSYFQRDLQICWWSFLHRSYMFCLLMKNSTKNKNFWIRKKIYEIRKRNPRQNCSSQEDIQIYFRLFFDRTGSFRFNCKKRYQK